MRDPKILVSLIAPIVSATVLGTQAMAECSRLRIDSPVAQSWHKDVDTYLAQQRLKFSSYFREAMNDAGNQPRESVVEIDYTADSDGIVRSVDVCRTSGFPSLDKAAVHYIEMSSPIPRAPVGLKTNSEAFAVELVFVSPNAIKNLQQERLGGDN